MKSLNLKHLVLVISAMAFVVSCQSKKREETLAQGDSMEGFFQIADYQNKAFPITTTEALGEKDEDPKAFTVARSNEKDKTNNLLFPLVKYSSSAPLLKTFNNESWPLTGKPNTTDKYSFVFQITKTHLIVYKKAKKEDLSATELLYAKPYGTDLLTPQFSMPVKLLKVSKTKDDKGDEGSTLRVFPVEELENAQYFKPQPESAQFLSLKSREFIFAKSFFDGEWFFASTIVEKQEKEDDKTGLIKGLDLSVDVSMESVSRVKFNIEQYRISAKNTNVDSKLTEDKEKEKLNATDVLSIPAESMDFRLKPTAGSNPSLEEEILNNSHEDRKDWKTRGFVKLNFDKVSSLISEIAADSKADNDATLVDLQVDENYFGFTILYNTKKTKVRYSLRKATASKEGRKAIAADIDNNFGFFTTRKHFVLGAEHVRIKDYEQNIFLNRFMPDPDENGVRKIVYHFSKGSPVNPRGYREAAIEAIRQWNEVFAQVGANIQLVVDESIDVDLGDIRYNIINLIDDKSAMGGLLGYGPSVSDTKSGEIISATANIYLSTFRAMLIHHLRNYVYFANGKIQDRRMYDSTKMLNSIRSDIQDKLGQEIHDLDDMIETLKKPVAPMQVSAIASATVGRSAMSAMVSGAPVKSAKKQNTFTQKRVSSCGNFSINESEVIESAQKLCPELQRYLTDIKAQSVNFIDGREAEVLNSCAEKILAPELVHTILHEVGHNLGLRHNFFGSADAENFSAKGMAGYKQAKKAKIVSSSIMDYLSAAAPVNKTLGSYDKAAIAYAYTGRVETADSNGAPTGQFVDLDTNKSMVDNARAKGLKFRKYLYCADEETNPRLTGQHALCMAHDWGTSPLEIVQNKINDYNSYMATSRYRFDMIAELRNDDLAMAVNYYHINGMMRIYGQWRVELAKHIPNKDDLTLYGFSGKTYEQMISDIAKGLQGAEKKKFLEYYAAARLIGDFIMDLSFTLPKMCVVTYDDNKVKAFSFEAVAKDLNSDRMMLSSCQDQAAANYFAQAGKVVDIKEQGEVYSDIQTNIESRDHRVYWMPDVVGIGNTVEAATKVLTSVTNWSREHERLNFNPIILEEPDLREKYIAKVLERIQYGFRTEDGQQLVKAFTDTQGIDVAMFNTLSASLRTTTGNMQARVWSEKFVKKSTYSKDQVPSDAATWVKVDEGVFWFAGHRATHAIGLLNQIDELRANQYYISAHKASGISAQSVIADLTATATAAGVDLNTKISDLSVKDAMAMIGRLRTASKAQDGSIESLWSRMMFPVTSLISLDRMIDSNEIPDIQTPLMATLKTYQRNTKNFEGLTLAQLIENRAERVMTHLGDERQNAAQFNTLRIVLIGDSFGQ